MAAYEAVSHQPSAVSQKAESWPLKARKQVPIPAKLLSGRPATAVFYAPKK